MARRSFLQVSELKNVCHAKIAYTKTYNMFFLNGPVDFVLII